MDSIKVLLNKEFLLFLLGVLLLGWICYDGLELMVGWWERDEYSHGYMIPLVAIYLAWQKREALAQTAQPGSWLGLLVLAGALMVWLLGEVSSIYTIIQYAFWHQMMFKTKPAGADLLLSYLVLSGGFPHFYFQ